MIELLHNGLHPFDLDGFMFAFGQMGLLYSYGVSMFQQMLRWRPWRRSGLRMGENVRLYHREVDVLEVVKCEACNDMYHGQGVDWQRTGPDGDEMKVIAPDPCDVAGCPCAGEEVSCDII
jgi:hypothetical protein